MRAEEAGIIAMAAILIIMAVIVGFVTVDNRAEQTHPAGVMTGGDEQIHPHDLESPEGLMIPMDEVIYIPAYPDDECAAPGRILIDMPIRVVDADGTVYWHWFYENRSNARNRANKAVYLK